MAPVRDSPLPNAKGAEPAPLAERPDVEQLQNEVRRQGVEIEQLRLSLGRESSGRLLAEEALDEAKDRIQLALSAAGLALWDWQLASPRVFFTARWAEILGHEGADGHWDASDLPERTHPDDRANLRALTSVLISGQQLQAKAHFRVRNNRGDWIWIESHATVAEHDAGGRPLRLMGTHADITERKQLEVERELALARSERKTGSGKSLLDGIRQEIQAPLTALMDLMRMLVASPLNADQKSWLEAMDQSAHALLGQLDDALDATLIATGELALERVPYRLGETLEELCLLYAQQAQGKSLRWSLQVASDVPEIVEGDPARLRQVLATLLSNATRFTSRAGRVRVMASLVPASNEGQRCIRLQVSDNGIGIDTGLQAKLFDAPSTGLTEPALHLSSGGLGLPHCSKLVALMGGRIALRSTPGHGSVFTVTLPLHIPTGSSRAPGSLGSPIAPIAPPPAAGKDKLGGSQFAGLNVVVAEDHPVNTLLMGQLLRRMGCDVRFAQTGEDVVRLWEQGGVELVLMDVQMPGTNGLQATQRIRELEAQRGLARTPIIAVTANSLKGDREACMAVGMDGFAMKPVNPNTLIRTIAEVLGIVPEQGDATCEKPVDPTVAKTELPPTALHLPTAASALDIDKLRRRLDGDEASLHQLAQAMQSDLELRLQELKKALLSQDADLAKAHAHGLKGSLASMTADRGARLAKGLEVAALAHDWRLFARAMPMMEAESRQIAEALNHLLSERLSPNG